MPSEPEHICRLEHRPRCARELPGILLELCLKALEERKGVGGRTSKPADHVALSQPAHFSRIRLDDGLADRDLAISAYDDTAVLAHSQNCGGVPEIRARLLHANRPC